MNQILSSLTQAFTLAFVVTSMFSLGLGLTVRQILEPLKDMRLVIMSLVANFVIVPAVAWGLGRLLSLDQDLAIGLVLMGVVAGAPLALKATQIARGNIPFSASLVTLQVVGTVLFLPLVLPLLIPGIAVDAVALALPLTLQVLLPLGLGLLMNARYDEEAEMTRPIMGEIGNISLAMILVLNLANVGDVLGLLGTGAILATLLVIGSGVVAGYFLGGSDAPTRRTLAVSTAQRNYAAAFVIAGGNFGGRPTVFLLLLAASLISMIVIMVVAGEFGRRVKRQPGSITAPTAPVVDITP